MKRIQMFSMSAKYILVFERNNLVIILLISNVNIDIKKEKEREKKKNIIPY